MRQTRLPWAEPKARFTALFERLAIDVLRETDVLGATRILRISWDEAHHIMERAVARGLAANGELGERQKDDLCEAEEVAFVAPDRKQS